MAPAFSVSGTDAEGEPENIEARARWYVERHGDRGRIDPERQRARIAAEYARRRAESGGKDRHVEGVGGTEWISLGPTNGAGRMTAVAPHPGLAGTVYAGAAGGGVWKTTDGGSTWTPLTEALHDLSVGALALAPSNPSVLYVGTGEGDYASAEIPGIGLVKSTDGGASWILPDRVLATHFHRIRVHPTNPDELVVGTNAGAFRSTDGGAAWTNVISPDTYGEVPDIARASDDPGTLYATTWCQSRRCTFTAAHVLKSVDGGVTWTDRSNGLPLDGRGGLRERTAIAISPSNSSVLYAARAIGNLVTGVIGSHIYKSADGGGTWTELTASASSGPARTYLGAQSYYDNALVVSPTNPNVLVAGGVGQVRTADGGVTFSQISQSDLHPDSHDLQYQGATLWIATDGGIWSSADDSATVVPHNSGLVTRQYYALSSDRLNPTRIVAGSQDNGNVQRLAQGTVWRSLNNAGDGFQSAIHPLSPGLMWNTSQGVRILRTTDATSDAPHFRDVSPPVDDEELIPFFSIVRLDPNAGSTLYTGSTRVWRSRDGGDTWQPLTTTTADGSVWSPDTWVTSVALTPASSQALLVGKEDGIFRSEDGGRTWRAGSGIPDAIVTSVELDPRDPFRAYATFATTVGPSLFRSDDGGSTWTASATGLPPFAAQVVRVDPTDSTDLFCGTDVGVFRSTDRGLTWSRFGTGLPAVSVHDVDVHEDGSIVRIATYGRGIWELAIPGTGNSPPVARISVPAATVIATVGDAVDFTGSASDPDPGDSVTATWFFPDNASMAPLGGPSGTLRHVFRRAGSFSVSLAAQDSRGARGAASVLVSVREAADACEAAAVFPSAGPFPYTIQMDDQADTTDPLDPNLSCFGPGFARERTTWFEFTPTAAGTYEFSTCGAPVPTVLSVYTGAACGPFTAVPSACKGTGLTDTDCGPGASGMLVSASVAAGQTLRVMLSGIAGNDGGPVPVTVSKAGSAIGLRVVRVSEPSGPSSGGSTVAIAGNGFGPGASVSFGGMAAAEVVVGGNASITARTPAHASGSADVSVTMPGLGTATLQDGFRYEDAPSAPCSPTPTSLCLNGGRFRAEARWRVAPQGQSGAGTAVALTGETGYFWFFSANNIELVVKVVDGRAVNGKFWVFYGALSNVQYEIAVTDLETGDVRVYANPDGRLSSVADTAAF